MRDFDDFDVGTKSNGGFVTRDYSMFNVQSLIEQIFFFCLLCCLFASRLERAAREHVKLQN